ncbi:MAG: hypothetical protein HOP97_00250 [Terrabacter sp.]|nr:hypothetical protein [Terrabacter sp.]
MSIPPPDERYTWPTQPAGARRARREAVQRTHADLQPGSPAMTRRQGVVAGTVFAVAAVWGTLFRGVELPGGLALLALGFVAAAVATSAARLRPFAQGFLLACLVAGPLAVLLLMVLLVALFANMGP